MTKQIKKRVIESEIEEAKSSNKKKIFIMIIVLLLIIILGLVLFLLYDYKIIFPPEEEVTVTSDDTAKTKTKRHEDKYVSLSVDNSNIVNLYNNVHDNVTIGGDEYLYNTEKATVSDMSEDYKFRLAYNVYKKDIVYLTNEENTRELSESNLKSAYEMLFGTITYTRPDTVMDSCIKLSYDSLSKKYISDLNGCVTDANYEIYDKIIEVKKNSKELLITGAVVFNYGDTNNICKDINCNEILTQNDGDYTREKHFKDYIEANKENLQQYTFSFTLGDDGFYYYTGFERTND